MVLRRCRALLRDEQLAMDAMQDTFVKLLNFKQKLVSRSISSFLYTIATNTCLNQIRSVNRRSKYTAEYDLITSIAMTGSDESRYFAQNLLSKLFSEQKASTQTIAVMHLVDGLTLVEVAEQVGLSVSGVRKRLSRLRGRLKELEGTEL